MAASDAFFALLDWIGNMFISYWWVIAILGVMGWEWKRRRDAKLFNYNVRAFRRREGAKRLEENYKAGYFKDKVGIVFFSVKTGKWWWEKRNFYTLPDPEYMDENNRVYYEIVNPNMWVQVKRTFIPDKIKLQEVVFLKDFGAYKAGFTTFVRESHIDALTRHEGLIQVTGNTEEIEASDVTYKPITSADKKLVSSEVWDVHQSLGMDWKSTAIWVGGAIFILVAGLIAYLLVSGNFN